MATAYSSVSQPTRSIEWRTRPRSRCRAKPPSPQPSRATDTATKAKWYQIVAEKMRVRPISNMRPENATRNTPAWTEGEGEVSERIGADTKRAAPARQLGAVKSDAARHRRGARRRRIAATAAPSALRNATLLRPGNFGAR